MHAADRPVIGFEPASFDPASFDPASLASRIATGLHRIGLAMKHRDWQQATEEGLSATQGQILAALVTHGPLTGSELSLRLGVTLPTVSDSARVLVGKRLVTKRADPRHPRAGLFAPTKAGAALGAQARSWPEFMAGAVTELDAEEQRAFFAGVVKMIRGAPPVYTWALPGALVVSVAVIDRALDGASSTRPTRAPAGSCGSFTGSRLVHTPRTHCLDAP